ncbi:MAG: TIGR03960 family B12-binding radical SAM protein [Candidatus Omnitrophota bacterium]|jgi:radical SAM family uncharacterized protein|nr:MAG: TIGR03960 family B12-binding radical SAM protein [Candidatus Omnitrophota bacterium]
MNEEILLKIQKPGQYIGREWNIPKKDFLRSGIKVALCFPDLYEIGMSNLGIRILYSLLNSLDDVSCERFFSPGLDLEHFMRQEGLELVSLESASRMKEFDIVGFSLSNELGYTNVLNMLELSGLPLLSSLRDSGMPLVIAGGPCVMNPEPMHEFFDLFVIGEAEEAIRDIINVYRDYKKGSRNQINSKRDLLVQLSAIEGVYVPSLYDVEYDHDGRVSSFKPNSPGVPVRIAKRFVKDLNSAYYPLDWLVPYVQIVHDRINIEIMRGCPNKCRFCQASSQYSPLRFRKIDNVIEFADKLYKATGYEEISLTGLSVSDYPQVEHLFDKLTSFFKDKGVGLSMPSIKPRDVSGNLASTISTIKKSGLTFAPEAGSQKLRDAMDKRFDTKEFFNTLQAAYQNGYNHVKLYFMIGLPGEDYNDLDSIVDMANEVSFLRKKNNLPAAQVNISINNLIPKPHTSFQWLKMESQDAISQKQEYLRKKSKNKKIKINFHDKHMSLIEAVFSRGDRRLSQVINKAFSLGARFDAWKSNFSFEIWMRAFAESNIDPQIYVRQRDVDEILPWDFLDIGAGKESLKAELTKCLETVQQG